MEFGLNSRQRERPRWILRQLGLIWQRRCSRFTVLMVRDDRYYGGSCAAGFVKLTGFTPKSRQIVAGCLAQFQWLSLMGKCRKQPTIS